MANVTIQDAQRPHTSSTELENEAALAALYIVKYDTSANDADEFFDSDHERSPISTSTAFSESRPPYQYTPLDPSSDEIRLVSLKCSGRFYDPIECEIMNISISRRTDIQEYEALSYCWGDASKTRSILISGTSLQVTSNLYAALQQLGKPAQPPRLLWVDAICINQDDIEERSRQVLRMKEIYLSATCVISWLGDDEEGFSDAVRLMTAISNKDINTIYAMRALAMRPIEVEAAIAAGPQSEENDWGALETRNWLKVKAWAKARKGRPFPWDNDAIHSQYRRKNLIQLDREGDWKSLLWLPCWEALNRLFNRTYWTRTWIIQEFVVAREVRIQCGRISIPWRYVDDTFEQMLFEQKESGIPLNELFTPTSGYLTVNGLRNLRRQVDSGHNPSLLEAMTLSWFSQAFDPRDKVFAVLSFASDGPEIVPNPNYEESVKDLFALVTRAILLKTGRLDLCCLKSPSSFLRSDEPSWVPSWLEVGNNYMGWELHSMTANLKTKEDHLRNKEMTGEQTKWTKDDATRNTTALITAFQVGRIVVRGMLFDTIDGLGAVLPYNHATFCSPKEEYKIANAKTSRSAYGSTAKTYSAIWRSLVMDEGVSEAAARLFPRLWSLEGQEAMRQVDPFLAKWLRANEGFVIGGKTLWQWAHVPRKNKLLGMGLSWLEGQLYPEKNKENTIKGLVEAMYQVVRFDRRIAVTEDGWVGMVHPQTRPGDRIFLAAGCGTPLVLREDLIGYRLVGPTYIHGLMHGERYDESKLRDLDIY